MGKFSFDEGRHIVISFYSEGFSYYNLGYNPHVKLPAKSWLYKGLTKFSIMTKMAVSSKLNMDQKLKSYNKICRICIFCVLSSESFNLNTSKH